MRNSNPGVSIVSAQRPNSNLDSMFAMQATGRDFQHGSNFCFPGSILLVVMIHRLLEECIHDKPLRKELFSSVLSREILSNFNNTQKSCIHTKFTHFVSL